jgi:hypothetical protein
MWKLKVTLVTSVRKVPPKGDNRNTGELSLSCNPCKSVGKPCFVLFTFLEYVVTCMV